MVAITAAMAVTSRDTVERGVVVSDMPSDFGRKELLDKRNNQL
jgi:hypothetical protein